MQRLALSRKTFGDTTQVPRAGRDAGRRAFELPIDNSALPPPQRRVGATLESRLFAPLRRSGQRLLYKGAWAQDEL